MWYRPEESDVNDLPDSRGDQVTTVVWNVDSPEEDSSFQQMMVPNGDTAQECEQTKSRVDKQLLI